MSQNVHRFQFESGPDHFPAERKKDLGRRRILMSKIPVEVWIWRSVLLGLVRESQNIQPGGGSDQEGQMLGGVDWSFSPCLGNFQMI